MGTDIDALREYEWETMLGGEIYEVFGRKGLKLGTQANKMLKVLKEKKEIPDTCESTLAKKKADKMLQRGYFENLSDSGLGILRAGMRFYVNSIIKQVTEVGDVSANIRARCAHLAVDPEACMLLDTIFAGRQKEEQRAALDEKRLRNNELWNALAADFFNNAEWVVSNCQTDIRVADIDPSVLPVEQFSGEKLRTLFSGLRTQYTTYYNRYHKSGNLVEGDGEGLDDFFENFCRGDTVFFYIHLLYGEHPPRYCMRDLEDSQKCDVGIPVCASPSPSISSSQPGSSTRGKKRYRDEISLDDLKSVWNEPPKKTDEEVSHLNAMTDYYVNAKKKDSIKSLEDTIQSHAFSTLSEEMQQRIKDKYAQLLLE